MQIGSQTDTASIYLLAQNSEVGSFLQFLLCLRFDIVLQVYESSPCYFSLKWKNRCVIYEYAGELPGLWIAIIKITRIKRKDYFSNLDSE